MPKPLDLFEQARNYVAFIAAAVYRAGQLDPLMRHFYDMAFLPQTQSGIVNTLCCLRTDESYAEFLRIQHILIQPCIEDAAASRPTLHSFFHFAALFQTSRIQLLQLLHSICRMRQYYFDDAGLCAALHELFTISIRALDVCSSTHLTEFCTMLLNRFLVFEKACETAAQHMGPILPQSRVITPAGGDLHVGGSPLFFSWFNHHKLVYKPRCMEVHYHLAMAIQEFNTHMPAPVPPDENDPLRPVVPECHLPILNSLLFDPPNILSAGYIELANHMTEMEPTAAARYAEQIGALICFTKLFGCTDLHRENVMATAAGPVIIDGECSFLRHIIRSRGLHAMGMLDFLTGRTEATQNCNFLVGNIDFCTAVQGAFRENLVLGFTTAVAACVKKRDPLWNIFCQAVKANIAPRIVPYSTTGFQSALIGYYDLNEDARKRNLQGISAEINKTLQADGVSDYDIDLSELIKGAFRRGLVPLFQVRQFGTNFLLMDGTMVRGLPMTDYPTMHQEFMDNLEWMATLTSPLP